MQVINNSLALSFSATTYLQAGGPLPSFSLSQSLCSSTMVNGCEVAGMVTGSTVAMLPTSPTIIWNSIPSPQSMPSTSVLASANGNYFLQILPSPYTTALPSFTCYSWSSTDQKNMKNGQSQTTTCQGYTSNINGYVMNYIYTTVGTITSTIYTSGTTLYEWHDTIRVACTS